MARNRTLLDILTSVRGEARLSLNPAHNISDRDAQIGLIQREQERLWADYDWPHLIVSRYIPLVAGQRYYDTYEAFNDAGETRTDLSFERLIDVSYFDGGRWREIDYGISDARRFQHDSHAGDRAWPPRFWERNEEDGVEVWPLPAETGVFAPPAFNMQGVLRLRGVRDLRRFADDDDRADLDDRLLTLFCAAKILSEAKAPDAQLMLDTATRHYARIKDQQVKTESFSLFNAGRRDTLPCRPFVGRYVRPE